MQTKQEEFYTQLRQVTETNVQAYTEFALQEKKIKEAMKFIAKQIEANNQMLTLQGLEPVKFER